MFGFPESPSDWGSKEYLRLFTIILFYISVRPLIQALYEKLGERSRKRQKKQIDDALIQQHKQERSNQKQESEPDASVKEIDSATTTTTSKVSANLKSRREARAARSAKAKSRKDEIVDEMPSDEDVSDLMS